MPRTAVSILKPHALADFIIESFGIEGLYCGDFDPKDQAVAATDFLDLPVLTTPEVVKVCQLIEPNARLRSHPGMNVWVGDHKPPIGGHTIITELNSILERITRDEQSPFLLHYQFERLHPFTDGNGRTGRLVWLWQMTHHHSYNGDNLFLQQFYFQALQ